MTASTRILGVGSPFGDDRIGWLAVDFIRDSAWYRSLPPATVSLESLDRPGPSLLTALEGASHAIVIDAMRGGVDAGSVELIALDQLAWSTGRCSSHALGVAETLLLGHALALLPPRLTLLAVKAGQPRDDSVVTPGVLRALPTLLARVAASVSAAQARNFAGSAQGQSPFRSR